MKFELCTPALECAHEPEKVENTDIPVRELTDYWYKYYIHVGKCQLTIEK
jgi:hypothetical protein